MKARLAMPRNVLAFARLATIETSQKDRSTLRRPEALRRIEQKLMRLQLVDQAAAGVIEKLLARVIEKLIDDALMRGQDA